MFSFKQEQTVGDWLGATQSTADSKIILIAPSDLSLDAIISVGNQNGGFSINEPSTGFLAGLASSLADMVEHTQIKSLVKTGEATLPDNAWYGAERIQQDGMVQSICKSLANIIFPCADTNEHSVMLCRDAEIPEKDMKAFLEGCLRAFPKAKLVVANTAENKLASEALLGSVRSASPDRAFFWELQSGDEEQPESAQLNKFLKLN